MGGLVPNDSARFNIQMTQGVQSGRLNRDEFLALSATNNGLSEMRGQFAKDGISVGEQLMLNQAADRFERMEMAYMNGDYHPTVRTKNPEAARQMAQSGAIFDGLQSGSLNTNESVRLLGEQTNIAELSGRLNQGGLNPYERWGLNQRLDQAGSNIFEMRHNWDRGNSPFPGCF